MRMLIMKSATQSLSPVIFAVLQGCLAKMLLEFSAEIELIGKTKRIADATDAVGGLNQLALGG